MEMLISYTIALISVFSVCLGAELIRDRFKKVYRSYSMMVRVSVGNALALMLIYKTAVMIHSFISPASFFGIKLEGVESMVGFLWALAMMTLHAGLNFKFPPRKQTVLLFKSDKY